MEAKSLEELENIKDKIRQFLQLSGINLDSVLLGLWEYKTEPFIKAGTSLFAVRYSTPGGIEGPSKELNRKYFDRLTALVTAYLLSDPLVFNKGLREKFKNSKLIFQILRLVGNQLPYNINLYGQHAQALFMYDELVEKIKGLANIPDFDFKRRFQETSGVTVKNFVDIGFVTWAALRKHFGINRNYFNSLREKNAQLPKDNIIDKVLANLAADPKKIRNDYNKFCNYDRSFQMYDFNPIFMYPIIRPWRKKDAIKEHERLTAPLPDLIAYRIFEGIYYQMFNKYKENFSRYFGFLFQEYVGVILQNSIEKSKIFSEHEIRKKYPESEGKVPDWVIIENDKAILIECKATRFTRNALITGFEEDINSSLEQLIKGLGQLNNFANASRKKHPHLKFIHKCKKFYPLFVSWEPLYLINSKGFREYVDEVLLENNISSLPWLVLDVKQLLILQPHLASGISFSEVLNKLYRNHFNDILSEVIEKTNCNFKDCFLFSKYEEILSRINFPFEENSTIE